MSRQVKILIANEYYNEDYGSRLNIEGSITDWEEISDEDYHILAYNFHTLFPGKTERYVSERYILLTKDDEDIQFRIVKLKELLAKQQEKIAKEKKKRVEDEKKKADKKAERERKKYEELKRKFKEE